MSRETDLINGLFLFVDVAAERIKTDSNIIFPVLDIPLYEILSLFVKSMFVFFTTVQVEIVLAWTNALVFCCFNGEFEWLQGYPQWL
jgi:hypothetical protein